MAEFDVTMEAAAALTDVMEATGRAVGELRAAMSSDRSLIEAMRVQDAASKRIELTDAIRRFESARHRARMRMIAVAYAEGATDADICDLWQMSSEMVRRAKKEIAGLGAATAD